MLKKTITYTDFNGDEVSEDFYFHLSKAELVELELSHDGGLQAWLTKIVAAQDAKTIVAEFKNIILSSYGQRSADGRRFVKNQALREEFESTEAYSTLFVELVTNTDAAIEFARGIIPADMAQEAAELVEQTPTPAATPDPVESPVKEHVTALQLRELDPEAFVVMQRRIDSGEVELVG